MSAPDPKTEALVAAFLDDTLSGDEAAALDGLLASDAAAVDALIEAAELDSLLVHLYAEDAATSAADQLVERISQDSAAMGTSGTLSSPGNIGEKPTPPVLTRLADQIDWRRHPIYFVAAVVVLWFGFITFFSATVGPEKKDDRADGPAVAKPEQQAVAHVVATDGAEWNDENGPLVNSVLHGGQRLDLSAGEVEIEFASGARVVLQGPAIFIVGPSNTPHDPGAGTLEFGKLTARAPDEAHGFSIETEKATIVDLGTEFGVEVDRRGECVVVVFEGAVHVKTGDGREVVTQLDAGKSLRVGPAGKIQPRADDETKFVRVKDPRATSRYEYNFDNGRVRGGGFPGIPLAGQDNWVAVRGAPLARSDGGSIGSFWGVAGSANNEAFVQASRANDAVFAFNLADAAQLTLSFTARCGNFAGGRDSLFGLGVDANGPAVAFGSNGKNWVIRTGGKVVASAPPEGTEINAISEVWKLTLDVDFAANLGDGSATLSGVEVGGDGDRRTFLRDVPLGLSKLDPKDPAQWNAMFFEGDGATLVDNFMIVVTRAPNTIEHDKPR